MKLSIGKNPTIRQKIIAGAIGGIVASGAYALEQAWDLKAFDYPTDDFVLLGSMAPIDDALVRPAGMAMHFGNGALLGVTYALIGREILPGSPLARGLTWTMLETIGLYPLALLEELHPAIREGKLPSYLAGTAFTQQLLRHVAYGVALGPVTERVVRR